MENKTIKKTQQKKQVVQNKQTKKTGFLKKYWHIIVIVILLIFGMGQCHKSCSRNRDITSKNIEMNAKDSIISANAKTIHDMEAQISYLNNILESEKKHNSNFASIATGNQSELYNKINELEKTVKSLEKENKSLKKELEELNKEQ